MNLKQYWQNLPEKRRTMTRRALGIFIGAGLGLAYYSFVGCSSGGCPITSNPWITIAYGGVVGAVATF